MGFRTVNYTLAKFYVLILFFAGVFLLGLGFPLIYGLVLWAVAGLIGILHLWAWRIQKFVEKQAS